jgi:thiamine biosynthesis lipoprotein
MGTFLQISVAASNAAEGASAIEAAFAEVRRMEAVLSSWRDDSQLGRLNAAVPGTPVAVSPELFALLEETRRWSRLSGGAFDPAVGALIDAWDLRGSGRRPSEQELRHALKSSGQTAFDFDRESVTISRRMVDGWMTAGGFGKGAALRSATRALRQRGIESALLDFGGQLESFGSPTGEQGRRVGVAHPAHRFETVAVLRLGDQSTATSAASERFIEIDGERYGHILDPRTGQPVPAWGSVTVVASDAMVADLLSTAFFVMGPEDGLKWAVTFDDVGVLFLVKDGDPLTATWNRAMESWLEDLEGTVSR